MLQWFENNAESSLNDTFRIHVPYVHLTYERHHNYAFAESRRRSSALLLIYGERVNVCGASDQRKKRKKEREKNFSSNNKERPKHEKTIALCVRVLRKNLDTKREYFKELRQKITFQMEYKH
jgi:hypothetical protein